MTLFHFVNCLLLTYAPYIIVFRSTELHNESLLNSCIASGLIFVATQLLKVEIEGIERRNSTFARRKKASPN